MDVLKMIAQLREERDRIIEATLTLERVAGTVAKRRGRPPKFLAAAAAATTSNGTVRKRKPFSAATKKKMAAAQKARWAAKKDAKS